MTCTVVVGPRVALKFVETEDVQNAANGFTGCVRKVFQKRILKIYMYVLNQKQNVEFVIYKSKLHSIK